MYIFDGAMGTMLQAAGLEEGYCPELFNIERPEVVKDIHVQYLQHGSDVITTNTFGACGLKLEDYDLQDRVREINIAAVKVAKEAIAETKPTARVAGSMGPTGRFLQPLGNMSFDSIYDTYREQAEALIEGGVDFIIIETIIDVQEMRAALLASLDAREAAGKTKDDVQIICQFSFSEDGRTITGTPPAVATTIVEAMGADIIGINCSLGPEQITPLIEEIASVTNLPISCQPNAGMPQLINKQTVFPLSAEEMGPLMLPIVDAGASYVGGCCGTTVKHIRSMVEKTGAMKLPETTDAAQNKGIRYLTSERKTLAFGLDDRFHIVGERINPTGKKKFQACIRDNDFSMVEEFVTQQEESGASILDINMGMSGIDEKETLLKVMEDVSMQTSLPLCIDSSHVDVQEYVLRHYPGRALINSISMESAKMEPLLQIAKKYGAMFILLPVSDEGLPKDLDEKKEIIQKILRRALELGFTKEDIVVDGLVATVGANKNAALETLETIRYCKEQGLATICGLSNISFGLPERSYINAAFLTMAIANGLTMAIANPNQELLTSCMLASDLLLHKQDADLSYIEVMNERKQRTAKTVEQEAPAAEKSVLQKVYECVLKGNKTKIVDQVHEALKEHEAQQILNEALLPAINEVGDLFDKGIYFLPQLIASAEAMKTAIEDIQPLLLAASDGKPKATIVIATVEGDIHDIGKNLVALMLKNYGFRVIDLGKDVPKEVIIETAKKEHADIIALSALMTTTMQQMKHVIEYAKEQGVTAKVLIGGAVITQEYADEIGADGYSKDAAEAVKVAKQVLGLRD